MYGPLCASPLPAMFWFL